MTTTDEMRARFEKAFSSPPYEFSLTRFSDEEVWPGNYKAYHVQCAWEAWQACEKEQANLTDDLLNRAASLLSLAATSEDGVDGTHSSKGANMISWRKHMTIPVICTFTPRKQYEGRSMKPEAQGHEGEELELVALWKMDNDDPYPNEWALGVKGGLVFGSLLWIASGDVTVKCGGIDASALPES